ncbi:MAG: M48 family metallopeptidase [Syntrophaceae bacterium]|nr:M48 family metallopeptidase [Syntrophaceae bacterium]
MAVSYILKKSRKRRKTISLQITEQADVVVLAPYFMPVRDINSFIEQKSEWIQKNLQRQKEQKHQRREKLYESGEHFYFLGKPYPLEVFFQQDLPIGLVFWNDRFYLNCQDGPGVRRNYFIRWYKIRAGEYFAGQVEHIGRRLQLLPGSIRITSARTRWGSCSQENNLAFSFRLIMAPQNVVDYVIIHELMHIREKNHSMRFWKLLEAAMPEYKIHRHWLRENGHKFIL